MNEHLFRMTGTYVASFNFRDSTHGKKMNSKGQNLSLQSFYYLKDCCTQNLSFRSRIERKVTKQFQMISILKVPQVIKSGDSEEELKKIDVKYHRPRKKRNYFYSLDTTNHWLTQKKEPPRGNHNYVNFFCMFSIKIYGVFLFSRYL